MSLHNRIRKLWNAIADFETHEERNDSTLKPLNQNARAGARMSAYVILQELEIDKSSNSRIDALAFHKFKRRKR